MFDGYKHKVSQEGIVCKLVVTNVGVEDCGEVECRAFNRAGTATVRAQLHLQGQCKPRCGYECVCVCVGVWRGGAQK